MKSTKSASDSKPQAEYRQKEKGKLNTDAGTPFRRGRALKRIVGFRPTMEADLKYFYAAYKGGAFSFEENLSPSEFSVRMQEFLAEFPAEWVFDAPTKNGIIPVGLGLAAYSVGEIVFMGSVIWFPWASLRNKLESALNLIEASRGETTILDFVEETDQPFYVRLCKYGSARRVGTLYMLDGKKIAQYQSKT